MKTLNEYMKIPYRLEIIPDTEEGGFVASYPELPGCVTCGETAEQAAANASDAKKAWLEAALAEGLDIAEPDSENSFSGQFKIRIPKSLHKQLAEPVQAGGHKYEPILLVSSFAEQCRQRASAHRPHLRSTFYERSKNYCDRQPRSGEKHVFTAASGHYLSAALSP